MPSPKRRAPKRQREIADAGTAQRAAMLAARLDLHRRMALAGVREPITPELIADLRRRYRIPVDYVLPESYQPRKEPTNV
jgi:hypothetical protein